MEDIQNSMTIRNKNGNDVAYISVIPKEDMGKLEILLQTKNKDFRFKSPTELLDFIRKNFKTTVSIIEIHKATNFVGKRLRAIKRTQENAGVNMGVISSKYSSENEV